MGTKISTPVVKNAERRSRTHQRYHPEPLPQRPHAGGRCWLAVGGVSLLDLQKS